MPNGGFVLENVASLCDPSRGGGRLGRGCRYRAEQVLLGIARSGHGPLTEHDYGFDVCPQTLYVKIGSSLEKATTAAEFLR
jgi:hypothetical protein